MSPNAVGGGGVSGSQPMSTQLNTGAQINFGDLTPYLTYGTLMEWLDVFSRIQFTRFNKITCKFQQIPLI
jgi:hypothetical protein